LVTKFDAKNGTSRIKVLVETKEVEIFHQVLADAVMYLETLMRLYYLRNGFEAAHDAFLIQPVVEASKYPPAGCHEEQRESWHRIATVCSRTLCEGP
jgi:hypothetical protein